MAYQILSTKEIEILTNTIYNTLINVVTYDTEGNKVEMDLSDMDNCLQSANETVQNFLKAIGQDIQD